MYGIDLKLQEFSRVNEEDMLSNWLLGSTLGTFISVTRHEYVWI